VAQPTQRRQRRALVESCALFMFHRQETQDNDQSNVNRNFSIMFALLLVWWRWPASAFGLRRPKYSMLGQERRSTNK